MAATGQGVDTSASVAPSAKGLLAIQPLPGVWGDVRDPHWQTAPGAWPRGHSGVRHRPGASGGGGWPPGYL
eukprot:4415576-Alexandrium_andersonii.AAC.1